MLAPYIALWLETTFVVICALSFCIFAVCTASPRLMVRLNSVPWAFQPARNLDVEYQAVLYAALHTGCFNRLAHMTLSVDPTLWFALLYTWRPELFYALLGLLVAQASLLPSGVLGALMLLLWGASAALGIALTEWWLPSSADARHLSMTIILLNSVLRFIGHLQEPVPPGVSSSSAALDKSDHFEHVCSKALFGQNSWPRLVLLLPLIGIVSEFASGLPFRLSVVQAFCVASNLGLPMSPLATWRKCAADADRIRHGGGWRASPSTEWMFELYSQYAGTASSPIQMAKRLSLSRSGTTSEFKATRTRMLSWVISLMLLPLIVLIHVVITLFDVLGAAWLTLCRSCSAVFASFREEKVMPGSDDLAAQTPSQSCMLRCGANPVEVFDPLTADWGRLRRLYVEAGIPFVLRHADGRPFMPVDELPDNVQRNLAAGADNSTLDSTSGFIRILFGKWCAPLPAVDAVRQKLLPWSWRAHWPIWFLGNYTGGFAHVDLAPACINLYLLVQGRKDVVIVPPTETRKTHLVAGCDSMYIPGSAKSRAWLEEGDACGGAGHYHVVLEGQSLLVFNNTQCIHQFFNAGDVQSCALSTRVKCPVYKDSRATLHLAANPYVWWRFATFFGNKIASCSWMEERAESSA